MTPPALQTSSRHQQGTFEDVDLQMTFVLVSTVYAVAVGEPSFGDVSISSAALISQL